MNTQPAPAPEPIRDLGVDPTRWCGFGLHDGIEGCADERIAAGDDEDADEDEDEDDDEDDDVDEDDEDEFDDEGEDDGDEDQEEEAEGS